MVRVVFFLVVFSSSLAQAKLCSDLFDSGYNFDSISFTTRRTVNVEPANVPKKFRKSTTVEALLYFGQKNTLTETSRWQQDFIAGKDSASEALAIMSYIGKQFIGKQKIPVVHQAFLRSLMKLNFEQLAALSLGQKLDILIFLTRWQLQPPTPYLGVLIRSLKKTISEWTEVEFSKFAEVRRRAPFALTPGFRAAYRGHLNSRFEGFSPTMKLEVLGAELIQMNLLKTQDLPYLLESTLISLESGLGKVKLVRSLKDFYRGLMHMKAVEPDGLATLTSSLEKAIEAHLQLFGLTLSQGGVSGFKPNTNARIDFRMEELDQFIRGEFGDILKIDEYMEPDRPGFFDPVDRYYPEINTVVENNGYHHQFRSVTPNGKSFFERSGRYLRPIDVARQKIFDATDVHFMQIGVGQVSFGLEMTGTYQ